MGTGGGVFGQFFDFDIFHSPQYGGLRAFYGIKKAFSVDEICFVKVGTYAHFFGVFPAFVQENRPKSNVKIAHFLKLVFQF